MWCVCVVFGKRIATDDGGIKLGGGLFVMKGVKV